MMKTLKSNRIRVLVADDDSVVRRGVRELLQSNTDLEVISEAADGPSALDAARQLKPDVILLDASLPGMSGIEIAREIRSSMPALRIILLTTLDATHLMGILGDCAHAYLAKSAVGPMGADVVRAVYRDEY